MKCLASAGLFRPDECLCTRPRVLVAPLPLEFVMLPRLLDDDVLLAAPPLVIEVMRNLEGISKGFSSDNEPLRDRDEGA